MVMSYLFSYQQFVIGHKDFILSIGKTRMRENMRRKDLVLQNKVFCTSLFNLVITEEVGDVLKNPVLLQGA